MLNEIKRKLGITELCIDCLTPDKYCLVGFTQAELMPDRTADLVLVKVRAFGGQVKERWEYPIKTTNLCYYHRKKREGRFSGDVLKDYPVEDE